MKQYKVGDKAWYARYDMVKVTKPCPVCYGEKQVTLILGNKDKVVLPCDYCGHGFDEPSGVITEYEYTAEPEHLIITGIESKQDLVSKEIRYYSGGRYFLAEDLFDTKEEANKRCAEKIRQAEEEETQTAMKLKLNHYKSYAWNAGYHLREAKNHKQRAEYHERKAILCKAKASRQKCKRCGPEIEIDSPEDAEVCGNCADDLRQEEMAEK